MPNYIPVSKETHASKRWKRTASFAFAAKDAVAPLVAQELPSALMHLPMGFIKQEELFIPVAILGLLPGQNLFVAPDGRWLGGYTPAAFRAYPFQLANTEDGQRVLVIDEASGLVSDTEGEPFFDEEGNPAKALKDVLEFLSQVQSNRELTQRICAVLAKHQLIQPWPINVQGDGGERKVEGLFRIDEAAMNALPAEAFGALRQAGALPIAYCQLLSMQHIQMLARLAQAQAQAIAKRPTNDNGGAELLNSSDMISFDNL
jgi:hypothetical protein